jgi:AcrR family transcriptional regulator
MAAATRVVSSNAGRTSSVTADDVLLAAGRIVERHGVDALTMRRLSEDLGVAVTSIYWHVGNRDAVLDGLVDRLLARNEYADYWAVKWGDILRNQRQGCDLG